MSFQGTVSSLLRLANGVGGRNGFQGAVSSLLRLAWWLSVEMVSGSCEFASQIGLVGARGNGFREL